MAGRLGNEEPLHRAGLALGEWLLRVLQRKTQGRVPQWRNLLQLEGGPNHHRKLAQSLQHQAPTLCAWLSPAGTARDRTKARPSGHHELISQCVWYKKSVRPIMLPQIASAAIQSAMQANQSSPSSVSFACVSHWALDCSQSLRDRRGVAEHAALMLAF